MLKITINYNENKFEEKIKKKIKKYKSILKHVLIVKSVKSWNINN